MLIPRELFEAHRCASDDEMRYQLNGVHFTRDAEHKPELCATDGKVLMFAQWNEGDHEQMPVLPVNTTPSQNGFAATVHRNTCTHVLKASPKKPPKPILANVALQEDDEDSVTLAATDLDSTMNLSETRVNGCFPNYHSAIDRDYPEELTVRMDLLHMIRVLDTVKRMTSKTTKELTKTSIQVAFAPDDEGRPNKGLPMRLRYKSDDRTIDGFVMPLVIQ